MARIDDETSFYKVIGIIQVLVIDPVLSLV